MRKQIQRGHISDRRLYLEVVELGIESRSVPPKVQPILTLLLGNLCTAVVEAMGINGNGQEEYIDREEMMAKDRNNIRLNGTHLSGTSSVSL